MNSKSVTIRDVAEAAGVSAMTVTRVFRNECCVSDQTRQRVLENAGKLNYRPNSSARALRGSATRTIGIIASNVGVISQAMRYISIHLMPEEYITCLIDSLGDSKIVHSGLAEISARRMDALIMEYRLDYGDLNELRSCIGSEYSVIYLFASGGTCDGGHLVGQRQIRSNRSWHATRRKFITIIEQYYA